MNLRLILITMLVFGGLAAGKVAAQTEHPVPLEADADCASCHEDKTKGKSVHSAVQMGCTACHEVKTEGGSTTISFTSPKEELCQTCHASSDDPVKHGPYGKAQCGTCHDPHVSEFPQQTRAVTNDLCFTCHGVKREGVTVNKDAGVVTLPGNQNYPLADYVKAAKIGLDRSGDKGHPMPGHPLAGNDRKGSPITCLTCHQPHSSKLQFLLPNDVKNDLELCGRCHE